MPRSSRIDAPGALHHVTARGIERRKIFETDIDRDDFLARLGAVLEETRTACIAWCLIPDHFHLVLKTSDISISTVMRRLLTGYAIGFNRRHQRNGPLFQNRFKSVLCQEEIYLLPLVRYVHLNPLRSHLVEDLEGLDRHPYCGHGALMGYAARTWQDTGRILAAFGNSSHSARRGYRAFIQKGIGRERPHELTGGGLIRSAGGWTRVKALRRKNVFPSSDERILGDGAFVERVLALSNEAVERKTALAMQGMTLERIAAGVAELCGMDPSDLWARGRQRRLVEARSILCFWAVRELGFDMTTLARRLRISVAAVSKSVLRGKALVTERGYALPGCARPGECSGPALDDPRTQGA